MMMNGMNRMAAAMSVLASGMLGGSAIAEDVLRIKEANTAADTAMLAGAIRSSRTDHRASGPQIKLVTLPKSQQEVLHFKNAAAKRAAYERFEALGGEDMVPPGSTVRDYVLKTVATSKEIRKTFISRGMRVSDYHAGVRLHKQRAKGYFKPTTIGWNQANGMWAQGGADYLGLE